MPKHPNHPFGTICIYGGALYRGRLKTGIAQMGKGFSDGLLNSGGNLAVFAPKYYCYPLYPCRFQCLRQVGKQIIDMLDAHAQAYHIGTDTRCGKFGIVKLAVGSGGGMGGKRFGIADIH